MMEYVYLGTCARRITFALLLPLCDAKNVENAARFGHFYQRRIQDPVIYLKWRFLGKRQRFSAVNYFRKKLHLRCLTQI